MPLTHEQRIALFERPFTITRFCTSYAWGGTQTYNRFSDSHDPQDGYVLDQGKRFYLRGSQALAGFQVYGAYNAGVCE